jgi:SCP-2 sterol transfer family
MAHQFLSPEWLDAVRALRAQHPDAGSGLPVAIRMNLVVTEMPEGPDFEAHVDTTRGPLVVEAYHLDGPDLSVTVDYATAKALLVEGNPQAALSSFMAGKIQVQGDMTKLLALQGAAPDAQAMALAEAVRAMTA